MISQTVRHDISQTTERRRPERITALQLDAIKGIAHGFFTRRGGVSAGIYAGLNTGPGSSDNQVHVERNRRSAIHSLRLCRDHLATPFQVHSNRAVIAKRAFSGPTAPHADAVVTCTPGLAVGICTADCGPVLFADKDAQVVGAAHAGWRGALNGVLAATIKTMETLGARKSRICAVLGPTIGRAAYEVGPEFVDNFIARGAGNSRFFHPPAHGNGRKGHVMFDLPGYIIFALLEAGIHRENAHDLALCTYADSTRFYSYRRMRHCGQSDYGRLLSAIALAPQDSACCGETGKIRRHMARKHIMHRQMIHAHDTQAHDVF